MSEAFGDEFLEVDAHDAVVVEEAGDEAIAVDVDEARPDGYVFWICWWRGEAGDGAVAERGRQSGEPVLECSIHCLCV